MAIRDSADGGEPPLPFQTRPIRRSEAATGTLIRMPTSVPAQLSWPPAAVGQPCVCSPAQRAFGWLPTQSWLAGQVIMVSCWHPAPAFAQV